MSTDRHFHRYQAKLDFIKTRRLIGQAQACLLEATVIRDGLEHHLLHSQDYGPNAYSTFMEYVSEEYDSAASLLNKLAVLLKDLEEEFEEDEGRQLKPEVLEMLSRTKFVRRTLD